MRAMKNSAKWDSTSIYGTDARPAPLREARARSSALTPGGATQGGRLGNDGDSGDGVDLHPLCMKSVLDVSAYNANVRAHARERDVVGEAPARCFGVGLSDGELTHNFE